MKLPFVSRKKYLEAIKQTRLIEFHTELELRTFKAETKGLIWDKKTQVLDSLNDGEINIDQYDACVVILEQLEKEIK